MQTTPTITVNMDKKCAECRKAGAANNGICLGCTAKAVLGKPMKSEVGRAVQQRALETFNKARSLRS